MINSVLKSELIHMKKEDMGIKFLSTNFAKRCKLVDGKMEMIPPRFDCHEIVVLEANEWINNKKLETTVGIILWNKLFVEGRFEKFLPDGMYNKTIDKKSFGAFINILMPHLRQQHIPLEPTWIEFLKDYEFYGLGLAGVFGSSYTANIIKPLKEVEETKERLLKEANGDMVKMIQIEDTLTAQAKKALSKDDGYPIYDSGARGSFDNDYKNISISLGAVQNLVTGEWDYVRHNYIDGLQKEDIVAMGNTLVASEHPKAVGTADAGYTTKKFYSLFQDIRFDAMGTDCGSTGGITVDLTEKNIDRFLYQNMILGNKIVMLDDNNKTSYIGKRVKFRSPMFCHNKNGKKCSVCCGKRYYDLEIENAGLTAGKISNDLLNKGMKQRHSMKKDLLELKVENMLLPRRGNK